MEKQNSSSIHYPDAGRGEAGGERGERRPECGQKGREREQQPSTEGPGEGRDNGGRKKEGKNYGGGKEKTQDDSAVPSAGDR